ncbi:hypothetical protein [Paenibacillus dendritiformis]|uniref:hypothetical protein n=1 Tax=Paenibacillus dendritiformis TaxID=130049 RepID=UPI000DA95C63|nr:hypothetical protein [Paenibacillus dendritiformis]PZM64838.1 hypothetical protein DOE73_14865 [Paenibacillus dendritiformis]
MSRTTPATRAANAPQPVLRPLPNQEEIAVSVTTGANADELGKLLQGIDAFAGSLAPDATYQVTIRVEKMTKEAEGDGNAAAEG